MKKFNFKSIVIGLVICIAAVSIGFGVSQMSKKNPDIAAKSENISDKNATFDVSNNKTDAEAIEIMKKTGNWGYVDKYFPQMSANGIEKVVAIYNSKHMNVSEHKKASDYIKSKVLL